MRWHSIAKYLEQHSTAVPSFSTWAAILNSADWANFNDLVKTFPSADIIGGDRVVFNIGGNNYRVICKYRFGLKEVHLFVKWIGTHAEYTKLCKQNKQFVVDDYRT